MKSISFRMFQPYLSILIILIFSVLLLCSCHSGYVAIGSEPSDRRHPPPSNKEDRRYDEERRREERKRYEEQEREARKYRKERKREARKRYEEEKREARKRYEEQEREARKRYKEEEREARKRYRKQERKGWKKGYKAHRRHKYRYYPTTRVYYDVNRKVYFYLEGDNWRISGTLPSGIRLRLRNYVTIQMDNDRPYTEHFEHKRKYGKHR